MRLFQVVAASHGTPNSAEREARGRGAYGIRTSLSHGLRLRDLLLDYIAAGRLATVYAWFDVRVAGAVADSGVLA